MAPSLTVSVLAPVLTGSPAQVHSPLGRVVIVEMEALGGRQKCHLETEGQVSRSSSVLTFVQRGLCHRLRMSSLRLQGACQVTAAELALDPGQSDFWCWSDFWRPSKSGPRMSTLQGSLGIAIMKLLSAGSILSAQYALLPEAICSHCHLHACTCPERWATGDMIPPYR